MEQVRASLGALAAQLAAEPKRLVMITEGEAERFSLSSWAKVNGLAVDAYHVQDFDVELAPTWFQYGGNKGRVCTALSSEEVAPFADANAIGIIDRDLDGVIRPIIAISGVYYADAASFYSIILHSPTTKGELSQFFKKEIDQDFWDRVLDFGTKFLHLRSLLQSQSSPRSPVAIRKYITSDQSLGYFRWDDYLSANTNQTGIPVSVLEKAINDPEPFNGFLDYHFTLQFIFLAGKKAGFLGSDVSLSEIQRCIEKQFFSDPSSFACVKIANAKLQSL